MRLSSTRMRLMLIGLAIAMIGEIAKHNGFEMSSETLYMVEGLLLGIAGLDTVRPLGRGYPAENTSVEES